MTVKEFYEKAVSCGMENAVLTVTTDILDKEIQSRDILFLDYRDEVNIMLD